MTTARVPDLTAGITPAPLPPSADGQLLAALPSAVSCAQRFVRFTLERWRLFDLVDLTETVTTELVSDAVSSTGVIVEHPNYLDLYDKQLNLIDLRLHLAETHVIVQVWDADPTPPRPREREYADSRNFYLPQHGGKVVWAALEIPPTLLHEGTRRPGLLPRRAGYPCRPVPPAADSPVEVMAEPALLERVRDGIQQLNSTDNRQGVPV